MGSPWNLLEEKRRQAAGELRKPRTDAPQKPVYGTIIEAFLVPLGSEGKVSDTAVMVSVRLDEKPEETAARAFYLGHYPSELALIYGGLKDLAGLRCRLERTGHRPNQGIVYIANSNGRGNLDKANKMPDFGTILAPAG